MVTYLPSPTPAQVDAIIVVSNDKLLDLVEEGTPLQEAFCVADDILRQARPSPPPPPSYHRSTTTRHLSVMRWATCKLHPYPHA